MKTKLSSFPIFFVLFEFSIQVQGIELSNVSSRNGIKQNLFESDQKEQTLKNRKTWIEYNSQRSSNESAWYGPTKFSHLSAAEFKENFLSCYKSSNLSKTSNNPTALPLTSANIPNKIDWRNNKKSPCGNCVTKVNDQKSCGACWAFATVETVESMHATKTSRLEKLSAQQVIDCSRHYESLLGCEGGDTCAALKWMLRTRQVLVSEKEYPTTDRNQSCKLPPKMRRGVSISKYSCENYVPNEHKILELLATVGPVSVGVDATSWQNYQGGIIQYHCADHTNHAVQIVGYDLTGEIPYYIVRNSWGTNFGHDGYLYIKYGSNTCGIAKEVSTVYVL